MDIRKLQKAVVAALEDIKARDIKALDVSHVTSLFDRVVIASADSGRQLKALASNVREKAKAAGGHVYGTEGEESGEWVLVDLGDIVVHIMQPAIRAHYNLEELWSQPKPRKPHVIKQTAEPARAPRRRAEPARASRRAAKPKRAPRRTAGPARAPKRAAKKRAR